MRGIIHSIMLFCWACRGSAVGRMVIFCCTHMEMPTRRGSIGNGSVCGMARSMPRNVLSRGTDRCTIGSQEYSCPARPARDSGVEGRIRRIDW